MTAITSNVPNKLVASNSNAISQGALKQDTHGVWTLIDYVALDCCMEHDIASMPLQPRGSSAMLAKCQSCKQPLLLPMALLFLFWKISFMYHCLTRGHPLSTSLPRAGWGTTQLPWCIFMPYRAIKLAQGASAALLMGDDYHVPWNASIKAKPRIWQFWPSVRSVSGKGLAWRTCKSDWMALMSIKTKP